MVQLVHEEKLVYTALIRMTRDKGFAPSRKELSEYTGLSLNKVQAYVRKLNDAGLIEVQPRMPRAIKLPGYEFVPKGSMA